VRSTNPHLRGPPHAHVPHIRGSTLVAQELSEQEWRDFMYRCLWAYPSDAMTVKNVLKALPAMYNSGTCPSFAFSYGHHSHRLITHARRTHLHAHTHTHTRTHAHTHTHTRTHAHTHTHHTHTHTHSISIAATAASGPCARRDNANAIHRCRHRVAVRGRCPPYLGGREESSW
jgi:hypothetical protein